MHLLKRLLRERIAYECIKTRKNYFVIIQTLLMLMVHTTVVEDLSTNALKKVIDIFRIRIYDLIYLVEETPNLHLKIKSSIVIH